MVEVGPAAPVAESEQMPARRRGLPRDRRTLALLAVLTVLAVVAGVGLWRAFSDPTPLSRSDVDAAVKEALDKAAQEQANATAEGVEVYRQILPSLVTVRVTGGSGASSGTASPSAGAAGTSLGAGFIFNSAGSVMTALHVVEQAAAGTGQISLTFADGTVTSAEIAQRVPAKDVAILQPSDRPATLVPAVLGRSVSVGDHVYPVGNPFGLTQSLSSGVVSGVDRTMRTRTGQIEGMIQFDAAVNPGNSGGPLLNKAGQVVGVVTGLVNPTDTAYFVGIGFAVPIGSAGGAGGPQK